ncbi:transposase [Imperialibacter roseus]|uniref:Transposase n=1 Tax=Imperialibacter roseus TaxID=1324217 RepID=A0ABZ0IS24_9BACT|nr:transposase [Imperialibacter roseus]WOK07209.1 transposase [Imperialibacter roseus]
MLRKTRALRVPYQSPNQLTIDGFETSFIKEMDRNNRWVRMSERIPWGELVAVYNRKMNADQGRPPLNGRIVLGAMIIKHLCNFSDRETIEHIKENIYMQYFLGYTGFSSKPPFDASLFVEIRLDWV